MRLVVENTDTGLRSFMSFPGGNQHFRDSPFYDNLVEGWVNAEHFEMITDADAVEAAAVETVTVSPAP